ncbi:hypothetical protein QTG54_004604 [Skeletonema marinoi]|uniref:Uncharacterized protein n=1 Tax=Skeletonema marinoi TaxID=267567 RepID=A0AAD8YFD9_9STRA|nr:hypothetical protein QTG54_004604 [Skeletonema marinoi]
MTTSSDHCSLKSATYAAAVYDSSSSKISCRPRRTKPSPKTVADATNTNKAMVLLSLLTMLCMSPLATAQQECSCAPREYRFRLDFSGTCPPQTPPFPPNDYFGSGVKDYTCSIGDSPVQETVREERNPIRRRLDTLEGEVKVDDTQQGNPIESVLREANKNDGETVRFISSIVTKPEQIPYRITMILRGFNRNQQAIQNTFTIAFTNTCGVPTFTEGERIGWVIFDELIPASDETCPALPLPSRRPSSYYPPRSSGYSSKGSKKSSKATSTYGSSKSGKSKSRKSGKSKSSKRRHRNLRASGLHE